MDSKQLHSLLPEHSEATLSQALTHDNVRAAVRDLTDTLKYLTRCADGSAEKKDWERVRDELLSEVSRLTQRHNNSN